MGLRSDGIFTHDEWATLSRYAQGLGGSIRGQELAKRDPEFNVSLHRAWGCAWWSRGKGILVDRPGFAPALIMADREER